MSYTIAFSMQFWNINWIFNIIFAAQQKKWQKHFVVDNFCKRIFNGLYFYEFVQNLCYYAKLYISHILNWSFTQNIVIFSYLKLQPWELKINKNLFSLWWVDEKKDLHHKSMIKV